LKLAGRGGRLAIDMRALALLSSCILALGAVGCASPHSGPAESLELPKRKKAAEGAEKEEEKSPPYGGLTEPDTCKWDFNGKEQPLAKSAASNRARSITQDAYNAMAGIETAMGMPRRNMAVEALGILNDALRVDPYSPQATYALAATYAHVGKKRCSLALLDRLATLGQHPDLAGDVGKLKGRAKADPAFEPFRKEADQALGE
jgi:hypothetical protein